jgi:hypothetical protein
MDSVAKQIHQSYGRIVTKRLGAWFVYLVVTAVLLAAGCEGPQSEFSGLKMNMGNLPRLSNAKTRSISPENFTGEKGKGGMATEGGPRAGTEVEGVSIG